MKYQGVIFDYRGTLGFKEIPEFVVHLIRDLYNAGYLLGVISNSDRYGDARWLRQMLVKYELIEYFQCVIGSAALESGEQEASTGIHKSDPRIFLRVLNLLGLEPHEAVYVGDSFKHDVLGAASLGMGALYVNVDHDPYATQLWDLLDDSPSSKRPNRITGFHKTDDITCRCMLRHLTEPLKIGQRIIIGKKEYEVTSFEPVHSKDEIIHAKSDVLVHMMLLPIGEEQELNSFSGIDLKD